MGEQKSSKFGLETLTEHMGAFPHPCAICILPGILHFVVQICDFVKLQGDLQKVCKNTGVLAHRVPDAYFFIGKSMGGSPPHAPPSRLGASLAAFRRGVPCEAKMCETKYAESFTKLPGELHSDDNTQQTQNRYE